MSKKVSVDQMAAAIEEELKNYQNVSTAGMKAAVRKAGNAVKKDIAETAPQKTGKYAKSWRVKTTRETASDLGVVVHSPSRYQIAHLLEHGHAKRGGGRVRAIPHIAPAEQAAEEQLLKDMENAMKG